ncbi:hypothetical protein RhiirA4_473265 [Rhizophagus irregularis]|uniref:Uncharacterized protein n=1 Tax=Rhizophagus irregularis TaxID=588596 RepID=A0A2I1H6E1_9GLOM|nr:hypothetical protein RhiirA4_473265 [Rhizophagus irregularis]
MKAFEEEEARMEKERQNETLPEEIAVDTEPELLYSVSTSDSDDDLADDSDSDSGDESDDTQYSIAEFMLCLRSILASADS